MRQFDLDPEAELSLSVIDATLAGEAVEPEHAELAELTLILAGQRPVPSAAFAAELDDRVARRFAAPAPAPAGARRPRRRWLYAPGAAVGLAAAVVAVVVLVNAGSGTPALNETPAFKSAPGSPAVASSSASASSSTSASAATSAPGRAFAPGTTHSPVGALSKAHLPAATSGAASGVDHPVGKGSASAGVPSAASSPVPLALTPPSSGRQIVQSAQLALSARPSRIDSVAQQVFDVVGTQNGVVNRSNVTAANNATGYAEFELSVPSANLGQTMAALSRLRGASVLSRTDASQDVTGQLGGDGRRLADARGLRTSLLRKLEIATTTAAIDSLDAQIRDVDAAIARDLATLRAGHRQVDFSSIQVTINAALAPGHPVAHGGGFTIGRAAHDAGRVLVVAAGVALITLAVLVPVGMLVALGLWVAYAIRRRRREQALDLV